jgi:hypothetical protein
MGDLDELKKLPAEERIRKLKELEGKKKKEIEEAKAIEEKKKKELAEAKKLMDDSVEEAIDEENAHEQLPIPQLKADSFEIIAEGDEEDIYATKRFMMRKRKPEGSEKQQKAEEQEINLEATVQREHPGRAPKGGGYQTIMEGLRQDYERLKSYQDLSSRYELTASQKSAVQEITGRLEYAKEYADKASDVSDDYKPMSKALDKIASAGMKLAEELSGEYIRKFRDDYKNTW